MMILSVQCSTRASNAKKCISRWRVRGSLLQYAHACNRKRGNSGTSRNTTCSDGVSVRGTSGHGASLLQPGDIRQLGTTARRSVHLDPLYQDLSVRPAEPRRAVAPRARRCPLLLHHFYPACYRLARHIHHDDGEFSIKTVPAHSFVYENSGAAMPSEYARQRAVVRKISERRRGNYL